MPQFFLAPVAWLPRFESCQHGFHLVVEEVSLTGGEPRFALRRVGSQAGFGDLCQMRGSMIEIHNLRCPCELLARNLPYPCRAVCQNHNILSLVVSLPICSGSNRL